MTLPPPSSSRFPVRHVVLPVPSFRRWTRAAKLWAAVVGTVAALPALLVYVLMLRMPGRSFEGAPPPLSAGQTALRDRLRNDVSHLATEIGERNVGRPAALARSADFVERELRLAGYEPQRQTYEVDGVSCANIEAERTGSVLAREIIVVGAHYDSARGTPGADDNATGAVAVLALARELSGRSWRRTVRFVEFVNEEPPYFFTPQMGSAVYARRCADRNETIAAMISLESLGSFSDLPGSQKYPFPISLVYPDRGNFLAFVGNVASRDQVRDAVRAFREKATVPSEGAALPELTPGVGYSDHKPFWDMGYPALMVTDTALFRNAEYHRRGDAVEKLDLERMTRVVSGLLHVVDRLAGG